MYYEGICVQIFTYSVIIWLKLKFQWGWGSKFHEYKKVVFSCMLAIVITHVCILDYSVDRNVHESCENAPKMFKNLQYEILLEKLLGGTCILYSISIDVA